MKKQIPTTLILAGLITLSLNAAPARKKAPAPVPEPEPIPAASVAPATKPVAEQKLHMANPFYLPYAGEFQGSLEATMQTTRVRSESPNQTYLSRAWPAGSSDSKGAVYAGSVRLRYGIFDRFGLGVGTEYYTFGTPTTERRGDFSSTYPNTPQPEGFTGPEFSLYGRFAGTRPGQIYFDAIVAFRPGFGSSETNKYGLGRLAVTGGLVSGINIHFLTFGIGGAVYAAPSSSTSSGTGSTYTVTGTAPGIALVSGTALVQAEWKYWYVRGSFSYSKYVDPDNARDPVNKYPFLNFGAGVGIKFTDNTLLDLAFSYTPEVMGDEFKTGYALSFRQTNTIGPNISYGVGFSFKLGGATVNNNAATDTANVLPDKPPAPVAPEKPVNPYLFKGWHVAVLGSFGLSNPNASFSTYTISTRPAYQTAIEGMALMTYYWNNGSGVSFGSGYAVRNLGFKDAAAVTNFPVRFVDLRAGYRRQWNVFMLELGLLYGTALNEAQVEFEMKKGQTSPGKIEGAYTKGFAAIYALMGINYPLTEHIFGLFLLKMDYGVTAAVYGDWPIFISSGSREHINLIPFNLGGTMGLAYKF